jgi:hypothetical protein
VRKNELHDPYLIGHINYGARAQCQNCGELAMCIEVKNVLLPDDIEPSTRLILCLQHPSNSQAKPDPSLFTWIELLGIGCGCYARAHRQIAHIQSRQSANK